MTPNDVITRLDAIATERYPMITDLDVEALNDAKVIVDKYRKIEQIIADYEEYKWERIEVSDIRRILDGDDTWGCSGNT